MGEPDRRTMLVDSYENAAVIVSGIEATALGNPTPCPRYDVAAMIDHLVEAARRAAALGRGQMPPPGDQSPHVELAEAPGQLRRTAAEAKQAWSDEARLSSTFTMPWGQEYTGAAIVDLYLVELAAHAWDLARATGQLNRLDPMLPSAGFEAAGAVVEPQFRDLVEPGSPFGAEVQLPDGADEWERFAAFVGRDPRAPLPPPQISG